MIASLVNKDIITDQPLIERVTYMLHQCIAQKACGVCMHVHTSYIEVRIEFCTSVQVFAQMTARPI